MKLWALIITSAVLGIFLGLGTTWFELSQLEDSLALPKVKISQASNTSHAPQEDLQGEPRVVVVNGEEHDFGLMEPNSKSTHDFLFKNEGTATLKLEKGTTSCQKCTISNLAKELVAPGETVKVSIESSMEGLDPIFEQTAEIYTSDPNRPVIQLRVKGRRASSLQASPESLTFQGLSSNLSSEATLRLVGFRDLDFKITGHELLDQDSAKYFEIQIQPFSQEELASEPYAKYGYLLRVTTKPGLPLGTVNQILRLKTNAEDLPTLEIPITGSVESDISIFGGKIFNTNNNVVSLGHLDKNKGFKAQLLLKVKGPHRKEVTFSVAKVDPASSIKVTFGEKRTIKNGDVFVFPLTIEILKNSPVINKLGTSKQSFGLVLIHSTHPTAKEIPIYVRFAVVE